MKNSIKILAFTVLTLFSSSIFAQQTVDIEPDKPVNQDGIELSYSITNERQEDSYSRFEITVAAKNKTGCTLLYIKKENDNSGSLLGNDPASVAKFECINATGKRLTSKSGEVKAKAFTVSDNGVKLEAGFMLKNNA